MKVALTEKPGPIGVFDSGYGGLTILHEIRQLMPQYDYLYLGDNARTGHVRSRSCMSLRVKPCRNSSTWVAIW